MDSFLLDISQKMAELVGHRHYLLVGALIMARMVALVVMTPFLGGKGVPPMVKIGVSFVLMFLVWPFVLSGVPQTFEFNGAIFVVLLLKEVFIGFTLGFIVSMVFFTVEMSGAMMDSMRFASMSTEVIPTQSGRSTTLGSLTFQFMVAMFFVLGFQVYFFEGLAESLDIIPILEIPTFSAGMLPFAKELIQFFSGLFGAAFAMAFPVAILSLCVDTAFGLMNRVAPQINAFFLSLPAKTLGGITVFYLAFPMAIRQYEHHTEEILKFFRRFLEMFN